MIGLFETAAAELGLDTRTLFLLCIGLGVALAFYGVTSALTYVDPAAARMAASRDARRQARRDMGILKESVATPKGVLQTFIPKKEGELNALRLMLIQAGYRSNGAVRDFTLIRVLTGLALPLAFILLMTAAGLPRVVLPLGVGEWLSGLSNMGVFQILSVLTFLGYIAPSWYVGRRAREARLRITESFPNALDLLQISVEAGLGLDAAMTRVGNELAVACPEISVEFLTVQQQIQAGRPRDVAMREMAERTGVDTVQSFAKVVQQSLQFGTPMTEALTTYAREMRLYREMAAQEMANKLPVKMSIVLASFMLPALVLMTVGPTVIRYFNYSGTH